MKLLMESDLPQVHSIVDVPLDNPAKILKTCLEMQIVCEANKGIGLSAVQVGVPWKLFIVKAAKRIPVIGKAGEYGYFLNCEYERTNESKTIVSLEGCLSIRSQDGQLRHFEVERSDTIKVTGKRLLITDSIYIEDFVYTLGLAEQSVVFQHEIDHQRAVLISQIGKEVILWQ